MIEPALTAGFIGAGMDVMLVGPLPTPAVAMLTRSARRSRRHDLGVAQSVRGQRHQAVRPRRLQAVGRVETRDRGADGAASSRCSSPRRGELGRASRLDDAAGRYIEAVKADLPARPASRRAEDRRRLRQRRRLQGRADRAVGARRRGRSRSASSRTASTSTAIAARPRPALLQEQVVTHHADLGIALDGDADRVIMVGRARRGRSTATRSWP